jgi:hypothetical protein
MSAWKSMSGSGPNSEVRLLSREVGFALNNGLRQKLGMSQKCHEQTCRMQFAQRKSRPDVYQSL